MPEIFAIKFAAAIFGVIFTILGPVVIRGGNRAHHKIFRVWLPHDEVSIIQFNSPGGRRAQELGEDRWASVVATTTVGLLAYFLPSNPAIAIGLFPVWVAVKGIVVTFMWDDAGHGAEILYVERNEAHIWLDYRSEEIARMQRDPARKSVSAVDIARSLKRWQWLSQIMLFLSSWKALNERI